jgi:hypothetical protein
VTTRDELKRRIDDLSDAQAAEVDALLDAMGAPRADEPLPPGGRELSVDTVQRRYAEQAAANARAQAAAGDTSGTPLTALEALGDYVGARPGLISDLLDNPPDLQADPVGAALVDDHRRQIAGLTSREWDALLPEQKTDAVAAGADRWR